MSLRKIRGFTLVELLVVISIIGMLMALLLPAVQAAREAGRRAVCANDGHQLSLAIVNFESKNKYYPGYLNTIAKTTTPRTTTYIVPLFPFMERNDLWAAWTDTAGTNSAVYLDLLVCPSNPPTSKTGGTISYVVNSGRSDDGYISLVPTPAAAPSASGICTNQAPASGQPLVRVGADNVLDGTTNTLLLSENIQAQTWNVTTNAKFTSTFVWFNTSAPTSAQRINGDKLNGTSDINHARPSSNHPGGVNAFFCDGHLRFIAEDISYDVYKQLMTSVGASSGDTVNIMLDDSSY